MVSMSADWCCFMFLVVRAPSEWAPKGVRVNAVAPGVIFSRSAAENYADPNMLVSMARGIPAQRLGTPEEVAAAVSFLLSPSASYITGTTLRVDGGSSLCGKLSDLPYHERMPPFAGEGPAAIVDSSPPKGRRNAFDVMLQRHHDDEEEQF